MFWEILSSQELKKQILLRTGFRRFHQDSIHFSMGLWYVA